MNLYGILNRWTRIDFGLMSPQIAIDIERQRELVTSDIIE